MFQRSTEELEHILSGASVNELQSVLEDAGEDLLCSERPFTVYMRQLFRDHGVKPQEVFNRADLPQRYAYRLITGEKRTKQRDYILRLCLAAGFSLDETQRALQIYGMSRLYARIPRDAALIVAFHQHLATPEQVNELLRAQGMQPLRSSSETE